MPNLIKFIIIFIVFFKYFENAIVKLYNILIGVIGGNKENCITIFRF